MIIRELVTNFGIDFDDSGYRKADRAATQLQTKFAGVGGNAAQSMGLASRAAKSLGDNLSTIGIGLSFAGLALGLRSFVNDASSVEEELNVVTQTFGASTPKILEWAKASGDAMGRSEYELRKYAGQLGAVIAPMLGNKEAAADMSKTLAELSVDLGSFFNKGDEETMGRLRSGLLGSSEAVDQLGINLRQEHIQVVMNEAGHKKNFKTLSEGEKVQMRFLTIMKDTKDKQGDAARTIGSYSNQVKVLQANMLNTSVAIGDKLMPAAKGLVTVFSDLTSWMLQVVNNSHAVEAALAALAVIASVVAGSFIVASWPLLLFVGGLTAITLALEDVYTSLEGGEGYFADFFKSALGEDKWEKIIAKWRTFKDTVKEVFGMLVEINNQDMAEKAYGANWDKNKNSHTGRLLARLTGVAADEPEAPPPSPYRAPPSLPGFTTSPWADQFSFQTSRFQGKNPSTQAPKYGDGAPLDQSKAGPVVNFGTEKAPIMLPAADGAVPFSVAGRKGAGGGGTTIHGGNVTVNVGAGATPDSVREGRRAAQELLYENNRSLVESASKR